MKYKCTHRATGLILFISNDNNKTELTGDSRLVKACGDYLNSFVNSYQISKEILQLKTLYEEEILIKNGSIWSIDINHPLFISKYLIPDLESMGYICELQ